MIAAKLKRILIVAGCFLISLIILKVFEMLTGYSMEKLVATVVLLEWAFRDADWLTKDDT